MATDPKRAFIAYCREDSDFALKLAQDLERGGAKVWIDLLEYIGDFYHAVKEAPIPSSRVLAILSPAALKSEEFNRQINFASGKRKSPLPVIHKPCEVPPIFFFDETVDLSADYQQGLNSLLRLLGVPELTPEEDLRRAQQIFAEITEHAKTHAADRAKVQEDLTAAILRASTTGPPAPETQPKQHDPWAGTMLGALQADAKSKHAIPDPLGPLPPPFGGNLPLPGYNLPEQSAAFVSYSRKDVAFVRKLAENLKASGARVWMDELDIRPGQKWSRAIQEALNTCPRMLLVLSPSSVESDEVEAEYSFALEMKKEIIPVLIGECEVPFRLRPFQRADFTGDYQPALDRLIDSLRRS